jgi:hypothetical protein
MSNKEILELAIALKPVERLMIIEGLLRSLDEPDQRIDEIYGLLKQQNVSKPIEKGAWRAFLWKKCFKEDDQDHFFKVCNAGTR